MFRVLLTIVILATSSTLGLRLSRCDADATAVQTPSARVFFGLKAPPAATRYFAVVFSYQDAENHVLKSHTFATFVKVPGGAGDANQPADWNSVTISWLPAKFAETLKLSFFPTAGRNYTLAETLGFAERLGARVRHWGPIEIDRELYDAAERQAERLASGQVRYKLYDSSKQGVLGGKSNVLHCIDAVGNIAGPLQSGTARGFAAGERVVEHFRSHAKGGKAPAWLLTTVAGEAAATEAAKSTALAGVR